MKIDAINNFNFSSSLIAKQGAVGKVNKIAQGTDSVAKSFFMPQTSRTAQNKSSNIINDLIESKAATNKMLKTYGYNGVEDFNNSLNKKSNKLVLNA